MTQSQPEFSPYDTGARCEPKLWQPNSEAVAEVMRSGEAGDIGNVDFTNGENGTVVTVHVSRSDDGMYTVHLMPMRNDDQIRVELHREKNLAIIEPSTSRPV
jgi:Cu/Zn superoxide dismutase